MLKVYNLNLMRNNNKLPVIILIAIVFYLLLDLLWHDMFLYLIGGAFGSLLKSSGKQVSLGVLSVLWLVLLIAAVIGFYKIRNTAFKYIMLVIVAVLLYIVDFIFYDLLPYDIVDTKSRCLTIGITVIAKSIILSLIVYLERKQSVLTTKPR